MSQTAKTLAGVVALLALAAGVALYAWRGVYEHDTHTAAKKAHAEHLFAPQHFGERALDGGLAAANFTKLTITYQAQTTVLEKRGASWRLVSPVQAAADRFVLDGMLSHLQQAKFQTALEEHPDEATVKRYGLDAPTFVLEAEAQVGDASEPRTVKLEGGQENTFDGSIFMRRNGQPAIFTAEGGVRYALAKTTFDLRDKQPMALEEAALVQLSVKSRASDWAATRGADGLWRFTRPFKESVDPTAFTAMISSHSAMRAQLFPSVEPAVFDAPLVDVSATLQNGSLVRLRFARVAGDAGERLLGLREDADGRTVAEFNPGLIALERNPMDLKDKAVVRFKKELVTRIVLRSDYGEVVLSKAGASVESWEVIAPRVGKAKSFKVSALLWTLASFKATGWVDEPPKDWAKFGFDGKSRAITLFGADGAELGRLVIGHEVPGQPGQFYVRGTKDQVALSDGGRFGEFPWTGADLLEAQADAG